MATTSSTTSSTRGSGNKKMASPSPITDIPDHLLAEIFVRLPAPEDLARTSATCVTFRRLLADGSFRRRLRLLHAPPLLGILDRDGFQAALPPHPSASAARALAHAAEFSFSFLPTSHRRWTVQDVRDGRVLLARHIGKHGQPPDLAVCDPLHRRYVLLPPLPHGLAASLQHWFPRVSELCWKRFLVPLGEEEAAAGDTAFRVILMAHRKTSLAAFYFSSSTDQWQATSMGLNDLALGKRDMVEMSSLKPYAHRRHYAYGCFYWDWVNFRMKKLLVLDTTKMEFSTADLPQGKWSKEGIAIVEAGEGRLGVFGFHGSHASDLSYTVARNKGESPSQWQMEKTISLDSGYKYSIRDATQRYLLLTRIEASSLENPLVGYFSMDIKTLQLQRLYEKQHNSKYQTYTYFNFPPSLLSSRRI